MKWRMWDGAQGWSKAEQCEEVTINKETACDQHQEWCGQSSWWVLIISRCAVGQSALPTLWGLRRLSTERRNDRFLIIEKLLDLVV